MLRDQGIVQVTLRQPFGRLPPERRVERRVPRDRPGL